MKVTIERQDFIKVLSHMHSIVERKSTIPILSNVKLAAQDGLTISATNVDLELIETAPAQVSESSEITVPAHLLYDIVRKIPDGAQIKLETSSDRTQITLKAGKSKFTLPCLPVDDFPIMASGDLPHSFKLSPDDLMALIDQTRFAISTEETRYYLNGIYFHAAEEQGVPVLRAVATDGHRLARIDAPLPAGAKNMPSVIVPRRAVLELHKLLEDTSDDVTVKVSDTKIQFQFISSVLTSKLIDGKFPDYTRVIPTGTSKVLHIEGKIFAEVVDRVAAVTSDKWRAVKISMKKDTLTVSAHTPDSGSATEDVDAQYDSEDLTIGFNARYLLDITHQIAGKTMRFHLSDSASPTIIDDPDHAQALYVLMPMRIP